MQSHCELFPAPCAPTHKAEPLCDSAISPLRLIFIFLIHYKHIPPRCAVCKHWCLTDLKLMVPYSVRLPLCPSFRNGLIPCLVTATPCNLFFINLNKCRMLSVPWNIPPTYIPCFNAAVLRVGGGDATPHIKRSCRSHYANLQVFVSPTCSQALPIRAFLHL